MPALLDVARGLAMVVVLYGHSLEILFLERPDGAFTGSAFVQYKVLASFVMALFFLLSGASAANLPAKRWRSVVRTSLYLLVLAYLVHALGLLGLAAQSVFDQPDARARFFGEAVESTLKGRDFSTIVVWFLVSLACVRLIAYGVFVALPRSLALGVVASIALGSVATPWLPNVIMLKTWPAGVGFFVLGMMLAPHLKHPALSVGLVLTPVLAWLALENRGCTLDASALCPAHGLPGEAVVWLHIGQTGFIPLFFLAGLLGCVVVLALARALSLASRSRPGLLLLLAWIGKHTLELLVLNGFVLVFLQPALKTLPLPDPGPWLYPALLIAVVTFHLLLLRLLAHPLALLQRLAFRIADALLNRIIALLPTAQARAEPRLR